MHTYTRTGLKNTISENSKEKLLQIIKTGVSSETEDIHVLQITEKYDIPVHGIGEIYEIKSVEKLRKRLLREYYSGLLILIPNIIILDTSENTEYLDNITTEFGYTDCPLWSSKPKPDGSPPNKLVQILLKPVIYILVLLEGAFPTQATPHIKYLFIKTSQDGNAL